MGPTNRDKEGLGFKRVRLIRYNYVLNVCILRFWRYSYVGLSSFSRHGNVNNDVLYEMALAMTAFGYVTIIGYVLSQGNIFQVNILLRCIQTGEGLSLLPLLNLQVVFTVF